MITIVNAIIMLGLLFLWLDERLEALAWREGYEAGLRIITKLRNAQQGRDARGRFMRKQQ